MPASNRHGGQERPSSFTTEAQAEFRRSGWRRVLWAILATVVLLTLLVLLGPDEAAIKKRFEYYGAEGEIQIMPEISIDDGSDRSHQLPKSLQVPPPPANVEIEEPDDDPDGVEEVPVPDEHDANEVDVAVDQPQEDSETDSENRVELSLPTQSNPDWFILHQVRPEYPLNVSVSERRVPVIFVKVGVFVSPTGEVTEVLIVGTNGSPAFEDAVKEAVAQWIFGWRVEPGAGRWIEMTWNFKSPYFTQDGFSR